MSFRNFIPFGLALVPLLAVAGCGSSDEVTGSGQSIARLVLDVPSDVRSGEAFTTRFEAQNIGLHAIENVAVQIELPAPLRAVAIIEAQQGTAVISNDAAGGHVTWTIGRVQANEDIALKITTMGTLSASEASRRVTVSGRMSGDGIDTGDLDTSEEVTITH